MRGRTTSRRIPGANDADAPPSPQTINARPGAAGPLRDPAQDQHQPTVLFNGMINPIDSLRDSRRDLVSGRVGRGRSERA